MPLACDLWSDEWSDRCRRRPAATSPPAATSATRAAALPPCTWPCLTVRGWWCSGPRLVLCGSLPVCLPAELARTALPSVRGWLCMWLWSRAVWSSEIYMARNPWLVSCRAVHTALKNGSWKGGGGTGLDAVLALISLLDHDGDGRVGLADIEHYFKSAGAGSAHGPSENGAHANEGSSSSRRGTKSMSHGGGEAAGKDEQPDDGDRKPKIKKVFSRAKSYANVTSRFMDPHPRSPARPSTLPPAAASGHAASEPAAAESRAPQLAAGGGFRRRATRVDPLQWVAGD
jgi:hypothetical protein